MQMTTLFWEKTGLKIAYGADTLFVSDLNPEVHITRTITRSELIQFALKALYAAVFRKG